MTQEELAERSGLSVQAIGALERGDRRRPRPHTVERLAEALNLGSQEKAALVAAARGRPAPEAPPSPAANSAPTGAAALADAEALLSSLPTHALPHRGALPLGSRMPLAPNPLFVGRGDELLRLARALQGGNTSVAFAHIVALTGIGGVGKTQLAVELVHRYGRFFAGGVYWLSFASTDEIPLQVAACASPEFENRSVGERVRLVTADWQSTVPRLLVFDNCEDESLLERWRPTSGGCRVLVTSRQSHWSPTLGVTALPMHLLPRADSIELLRRYRPDLAPDDPGLAAVARELGDLPLALHLAGSYLRAYRADVSLDDYLSELGQPEVLRHASLLGRGLDNSPSPTHHMQSLAQTFALSLDRLDRESELDRVAIALLTRMALLAAGEPVPRSLLGKMLVEADPLLRADGLRRLAMAGLIEEGEGWLRLHRLLAHFVRQQVLDPDARQAANRALIGCGEAAEQGQLAGPELAAVIPHLVHRSNKEEDERSSAALCNAAGQALVSAGDTGTARLFLVRGLAIRQRVLGAEHPDTAHSLHCLGEFLWFRGHVAAARPLMEHALAIRERALGPDHPDTGSSLNDLALVLKEQNEVAAARRLQERAVAIFEWTLGPDHLDTAAGLNNLGRLLHAEGDLAKARSLYERSLAIWEKALGRDHHHTAVSLSNLSRTLQQQGEPGAARALLERALAIRERSLGPGHLRTATSLYDLGALLRDQGESYAARPLFERALAVREHVLGADHPDSIATRRALAELAAASPRQALEHAASLRRSSQPAT